MATRYFTLSISFNVSKRPSARAGEPDSSLKTQKRLISCTPATSLSTYLDALAMERKNTTSLKPQNHLLSCRPASNVPTWREIPHAHTHKHKHANTHTHTNANTNTHTHTQTLSTFTGLKRWKHVSIPARQSPLGEDKFWFLVYFQSLRKSLYAQHTYWVLNRKRRHIYKCK